MIAWISLTALSQTYFINGITAKLFIAWLQCLLVTRIVTSVRDTGNIWT